MSSNALQFVKRVLPPGALARARATRRLARRGEYRLRKCLGLATRVTQADVAEGLRSLGLGFGDTVLVHSSLRSLGHVENGPNAVVQAFLDVIGPAGTLVVPTLTFQSTMYQYFEEYSSARPFDVRDSPSLMGSITETIRKLPGARRSLHPSHSAAAIGPQAEWLTQDHHLDPRAFGRCSPYYRVCELNGKIVMLGVDLSSMTALHVLEDVSPDFPLSVYVDGIYTVEVIGLGGTKFMLRCRVHAPQMSLRRDCSRLEPFFREQHILKSGRIGAAKVMLLEAGKLLPVMEMLMQRGITIYRHA